MIIYSQKVIRFISEITSIIKEILSREIGLKVLDKRFYNRQQDTSYPIRVVIYTTKSMLGYFDADFYELGFHECLMHSSKEQLRNIIRHELAHYMVFIHYGKFIQPHGHAFKEFCHQMKWSEEVYLATTCLDGAESIAAIEESGVLRKVKKLMALAASNNQNEAEQAMIKSQQLLLKHNIESKYIDHGEEEKIILKRILKQPKENAKMRAIARMLDTFFVSTVYHRGDGCMYLEIAGNAVNIEIAEYVAHFLHDELDTLWKQAQKQTRLKGMVAKNSFFLGIAKGYCNKVQALKKEYTSAMVSALMVIEKQLMDMKTMVYPRLTSSTSRHQYCQESSTLGEKMGRQLNITPGLNQKGQESRRGLFLEKGDTR